MTDMAPSTADEARKPSSTLEPLLAVRDLRIGFPSDRGIALAAHGVELDLAEGEILGLVGESGSGKSVTCRSIAGLVPHPGSVLSGHIQFDGRDLLALDAKSLREVRAHEIAMIFQDPSSSLNPVFSVGQQLGDVLRVNEGRTRREARREGIQLLERVGIPAPEKRMEAYPHELSGGMRQRVMIAMALAGSPRLLLADEPTTALDVTIQDQVLRLLEDVRKQTNMAMILVSHDMGVIGQMADRVAVMYAGFIVEVAPVSEILHNADHPYTRALIDAMPELMPSQRQELRTIRGYPPDLSDLVQGCPFAPRCPLAREACSDVSMGLTDVGEHHISACPFARLEAGEAR